MAKLIDSIKAGDSESIKDSLKERLADKLVKKIEEQKKEIATGLLAEAEVDDTQASDLPVEKGDARQTIQPVKIVRTKTADGSYRYTFPFKSRIYVVEFNPIDKSNQKYTARFFAKGFGDDSKFSNRFGISSIAQIAPVFKNVLRAVEQFLEIRRPQTVRFQPGEGIKFPSIFHQYIYPDLKELEGTLGKKYAVIRGDAVQDGSAFVLKKGGTQSILRTKGWKPPTESDHAAHAHAKQAGDAEEKPVHKQGDEVEEEIANAVGNGQALSLDRPTKSGLGFPGLAAASEDEKKNQEKGMKAAISSMERRK